MKQHLEYQREYKKRYRAIHLERLRKYSRDWNKANPQKHKRTNHRWYLQNKALTALRFRRRKLRVHYGITVDDYTEMCVTQKNLCAICLKIPLKGKKLVVDHDHKTKRVRQLLCNECNTGLGMFREDISHLKNAIKYIKKHK
jgi:hypothetical protein